MKKLLLTALFVSLAFKAFAAAPDISIGSASGYAGSTVSIPVTVDLMAPIFSNMFTVKYDPNLLTPTSVTTGLATTGWFIDDNHNSPGTLIIGMFSQSVNGITGNAQQIAVINFTVNAGVAALASPNLTLSNIVFDIANITTVTNGNFTLNLLGDVDGVQGITLSDAILIAKYSLGLTPLSASQLLSGDTSKDGKVTIYDAALIAEYVDGVIKGF